MRFCDIRGNFVFQSICDYTPLEVNSLWVSGLIFVLFPYYTLREFTRKWLILSEVTSSNNVRVLSILLYQLLYILKEEFNKLISNHIYLLCFFQTLHQNTRLIACILGTSNHKKFNLFYLFIKIFNKVQHIFYQLEIFKRY